ncbi:hypothetical protein [Aureimonas psammosilenae]|jgi:hypothetical protein|uniref:hypothetical protein n=1 Tax=Aureimonas psammosilenae TaxID=2495496 RepID=UPI001260C5C2|nr:hypothetical protein [Aureimonas psammosilenae]
MSPKDALSIDPALLDDARQAAAAAGVDLGSFVSRAVQEKLWSMRPENYMRRRAERADMDAAKAILDRAGRGNPPMPGDEFETDDR